MARRKAKPADRARPQKKKVSILTSENISYVDYKDVDLLRRFMSERAKIRARRVTGNSAQQQREVAKAIRIAREMALLPYSVRQVTTRRTSRREREARIATAPPPPPPPGVEGAAPAAGTETTSQGEAPTQPDAVASSETETTDAEATPSTGEELGD